MADGHTGGGSLPADICLQRFSRMGGGNASRKFAALRGKSALYSVNQELLKCCFIEGAARFRSLEQPCSPCPLQGSVDFGWAEKEILRDLGVRRAFVSIP